MKIVYCCYTGMHAALIAGQIHLQRLPEDRTLTLEELTHCDGFDSGDRFVAGRPSFLGRDSWQNEIYALGLGKDRAICLQAITHTLNCSANGSDWHFVDAWEREHPLTRWGRFCYDQMRWTKIGCRMKTLGIQRSYLALVQRVRAVKERVGIGQT